jgi:transposase
MSTIEGQKQSNNINENINILNFQKENNFFFKLTNLNIILKNVSNLNSLNIAEEDIDAIKKEIEISISLKEKSPNSVLIDVLKIFSDKLNDLKEIDESKSEKAIKIKEIIDKYNGEKRLTLKMISLEYYNKYTERISTMTISRIMRNKLKMRYRKTVLKNQKLSEDNYIIMNFLFLKAICRCIRLGLKLIYIDETGFSLNNTNLRMWRKNKEEILKGPKKDSHQKINLIMAINNQEIIYGQYYYNETIDSEEFLNFLSELLKKMNKNEIKNSVFVLDNATYHATNDIKKFAKQNQLKFLFTIPYKSQFNCIEYAFNLMKIDIHNTMINTKKELEKKIVDLIEDERINSKIRNIYAYTLEKYLNFLLEGCRKYNIEEIGKKFLNKKRKNK